MTRQELRDWKADLVSEVELIDADITGILEEIREAQERLAEAQQRRSDRLATLKYVRGQLGPPVKRIEV